MEKKWLNDDGSFKSDDEIKQTCHTWTTSDWEEYLSLFESSSMEKLLDVPQYTETISENYYFEMLANMVSQDHYYHLRKVLEASLETLPPVQKEIIFLLFWENASINDVCKKIGLARGTIYYHKDLALKRLSNLLVNSVLVRGVKFSKSLEEDSTKLDPLPVSTISREMK